MTNELILFNLSSKQKRQLEKFQATLSLDELIAEILDEWLLERTESKTIRERCVICNNYLDHKKPKTNHWIHLYWTFKKGTKQVQKIIPLCSILCANSFWNGGRWMPFWDELKQLIDKEGE